MRDESTQGETSPLVLVVDDDRVTRFVFAGFVQSLGCVVETAGTVKEALEYLDHRVYDLIMVDGHLPDGSGTEIAQSVRSGRFPLDTPIIAFSSDDDPGHVQALLASGAGRFLRKPISRTDIRALLLEHGLIREPRAAD